MFIVYRDKDGVGVLVYRRFFLVIIKVFGVLGGFRAVGFSVGSF